MNCKLCQAELTEHAAADFPYCFACQGRLLEAAPALLNFAEYIANLPNVLGGQGSMAVNAAVLADKARTAIWELGVRS